MKNNLASVFSNVCWFCDLAVVNFTNQILNIRLYSGEIATVMPSQSPLSKLPEPEEGKHRLFIVPLDFFCRCRTPRADLLHSDSNRQELKLAVLPIDAGFHFGDIAIMNYTQHKLKVALNRQGTVLTPARYDISQLPEEERGKPKLYILPFWDYVWEGLLRLRRDVIYTGIRRTRYGEILIQLA